jgi:hypothetical protein
MHKAQVTLYQPRRARTRPPRLACMAGVGSQREKGLICLRYLCGLCDLRGAITNKTIQLVLYG